MNQAILWILTAIMAVLMIVTAVFIARQKNIPSAVLPVAVAPAVIETSTVAEVPLASTPQTKTKASPEKPAEPVKIEKTVVEPPMAKPSVIAEVDVDLTNIKGSLKMSSPDIAPAEGRLPRYPLDATCYRKNLSPAVNWSEAPSGTKSYLLVLERRVADEAATWPWIMFNIPAASKGMPGKVKVENLTEGQGVFGTNPYGQQEYTGPCEPRGVISYLLRLFALDIELPLQPGAGMGDIMPLIKGHIIDAAEIKTEHSRM